MHTVVQGTVDIQAQDQQYAQEGRQPAPVVAHVLVEVHVQAVALVPVAADTLVVVVVQAADNTASNN